MGADTFTIGELGAATATKVETIRYYERIGLLPKPSRTSGNYRSYAMAELGRLSFIRRARDLGFTLDQVRELLALADDRDRSCEGVDEIARSHLAEVERKLGDLEALRAELSSLLDQCSHQTISACRIIETLAPRSPSVSSILKR
jgi:DNA-binding transcriptional MerR regulator